MARFILWDTSDTSLLRRATSTRQYRAKDLPDWLAEHRDWVLETGDRVFRDGYDGRESPAVSPSPTDDARFGELLELLHREGIRDEPGVLERLALWCAHLREDAREELANHLAGATKLAFDRTTRPREPALCRQLAAAAERERPLSFGNRVALARLAAPHAPETYVALMARTDMKTEAAVDAHVEELCAHRDAPGFEPAFRALVAALEVDEREHVYGALDKRPGAAGLLVHVAAVEVTRSHTAHSDLAKCCGRLATRDVEPLLLYLVEHGHRHALSPAVAALKVCGSRDAVPALERAAKGAWSPSVRTEARQAIADASPRPPSDSPAAERLRAVVAGQADPTGWIFDERQLLDQCVEQRAKDDAPTTLAPDRVDALMGVLRSHLAALEGAPGRDPTNLVSCAWLLRHPPLSDHADAVPRLLDLLELEVRPIRFAARISLLDLAERGALRLSREAQERLLRQLDDPVWTAQSRVEIAAMGLPAASRRWAEVSPADAEPERLQRILCRLPASDETRSALASLYAAVDVTRRRGLLRQVEAGWDAALLPVWSDVGRHGVPATQRAVVDLCRRLGDVAAEPFMLEVLANSPDESVRGAAMDALGDFGTIAALDALVAVQGPLAQRGAAAAEAIRARHLAAGGPGDGALSLPEAPDDGGGLALVAAQLPEELAGVELGRPATDEPDEAAAATAWRAADAARSAWDRLAAPPRRVPWSIRLTTALLCGERGAFWAWAFLIPVVVGPLVLPLRQMNGGGLAVVGLVWLAVAWVLFSWARDGVKRGRRQLRALRDGVATYAKRERVQRHTTRSKSGNTSTTGWTYHFALEGEDGRTYPHEQYVSGSRQKARLEDDEREPVLYLVDADGKPHSVVMCGALSAAEIRDDGRLRVRPWPLAKTLVLPPTALALAAAWLLHDLHAGAGWLARALG